MSYDLSIAMKNITTTFLIFSPNLKFAKWLLILITKLSVFYMLGYCFRLHCKNGQTSLHVGKVVGGFPKGTYIYVYTYSFNNDLDLKRIIKEEHCQIPNNFFLNAKCIGLVLLS